MAIDQFGKGDKCFGVAALMSTLPGLPMFGHGQIEGFTEKYGMEYRRPRYDHHHGPGIFVPTHQTSRLAPFCFRDKVFDLLVVHYWGILCRRKSLLGGETPPSDRSHLLLDDFTVIDSR